MNIRARLRNGAGQHDLVVATGGVEKRLAIPPKSSGPGSSVNGGELLLAALATCFCNDIYREAAKRGVRVSSVEVTATAAFGAEGEPAREIQYSAVVAGSAPREDLAALIAATDRVAEIQNTVRRGVQVTLGSVEAITVDE